jgi:hypothetical protein
VILALAATLAIVVQDHAALRAAPRSSATELTRLWQGDVLEIRGEHAGYLKVYDYRRERGGYLREDAIRPVELSETAAPRLVRGAALPAREPGSEALGISYGAAYLKAAPPRAMTAEPFGAIAQMAERLADQASGSTDHGADFASRLEVVEQFGIHMRNFERNGRMQVCYDGELFHRVLTFPGRRRRSARMRFSASRGPIASIRIVGPVPRAAIDAERSQLLEQVKDGELTAMTRSRVHARRAGVWASLAYAQDRRGEPSGAAAERALDELLAVHGRHGRGPAAGVRGRRAAGQRHPLGRASPAAAAGIIDPQRGARRSGSNLCVLAGLSSPARAAVLIRRCTYGIVRMASVQTIPQGPALVLAVQPLESWRELWVFHESGGNWTIDVLSPGLDNPEEGYVDFAGYAPGTRRLLIAREVKDRGRFRRSFEELRLDDLALVRQASSPELLRDFGRWQDLAWRRDTLALH